MNSQSEFGLRLLKTWPPSEASTLGKAMNCAEVFLDLAYSADSRDYQGVNLWVSKAS